MMTFLLRYVVMWIDDKSEIVLDDREEMLGSITGD